MRAAAAGLLDLAARARLRLLAFLGRLAVDFQGEGSARQQRRPRSVGAIGRGERGGVVMMRME